MISYIIYLMLTNTDKGKTKMTDVAPDATGQNKGSRTIRMRWKRVYKGYYVPACEDLLVAPVTYNHFCEIRKQHRPSYTRHRKVRI